MREQSQDLCGMAIWRNRNSSKFLDLKKNLKIELSSVGKLYVVSAILRNALTCLYGNQALEYFDLDPPSLNDYFA